MKNEGLDDVSSSEKDRNVADVEVDQQPLGVGFQKRSMLWWTRAAPITVMMCLDVWAQSAFNMPHACMCK
jgi:hypothetical protein